MNNFPFDTVFKLIDKSKRILLLTHARADADGLGAMISMYLVLKELGKEVMAVTNDPAPESLDFLPSIDTVQHSFASAKDFIITLDCSKTPVNKIKYNLEDRRVNIIISPKTGSFTKEDVSFAQGAEEQFDLVMTFDTGNLEHLGPLYDQNTELFFKTPIINVDHHASNTDFGQVNLLDVMAASTTEVVFRLLQEAEKRFSKKLINPNIATLLLAGIITDTGSFQHSNTSPQAMETAAELMDLGARQQEIIKNIYKTKKLSTLKLWGIVLSKVQVDPIYRMVWSALSQPDFREAGADSEETGSIIDDLLSNAPGAEVILLIKHNDDGVISVSMRSTTNHVDVGKLCAEMGGGGHVRAAGFKVRGGRTFEQVTSDVIAKVKEYQAKRLNIQQEDLQAAQKAAVVNGVKKEKPKEEAKSPVPAPEKPKKETYLEFGLKPGTPVAPSSPPAPQKAAPKPAVKPQAAQAPAAVQPEKLAGMGKRKRKRKRKNNGQVTVSPVPATPPAPLPTIPRPIPTPPPPPAPSVPPKPSVAPAAPTIPPIPVTPSPIAPISPVPTVPALPALYTPPIPPSVSMPSVPPVPPAPSAPLLPPKPANPPSLPKPDASPDVPDWLKAE